MRHANHAGRGFTLIEMLVVIAVVVLLLALLVPVLGRAKGAAQMSVCKSNLKQLGAATANFAAEHAFRLPQPFQDSHFTGSGALSANQVSGRKLWFNVLDDYLGQLGLDYSRGDTGARNYDSYKQDPVWLDLPPGDGPTPPAENRLTQRTLKMNSYLGEAGTGVRTFSVSEIPHPSTTVLFFDGRAHDTPSATSGLTDGDDFGGTASFIGPRHLRAANLSGLDGGVADDQRPIGQTGSGYPKWEDTGPMVWDWQGL